MSHPAPNRGWIAGIDVRLPAGVSHEVAHSNALDAAQMLMASGYDVTLRPILPNTKGQRSAGWDDDPFGTTADEGPSVSVACGKCGGGNVFFATCDCFRGTGHDWVIVGLCMGCRQTSWIDSGCPECAE